MKPEDIKYLIIHHTATDRDHTTFESVKRHHIEVLKMKDILYHFFIDGEGELFFGRPETVAVIHNRGERVNYKCLEICLTGNFENQELSSLQVIKLDVLLYDLMKKYLILPSNILGHCEIPSATLCPGKYLLMYLQNWRDGFLKLEILSIKIALLGRRIKKLLKWFRKLSTVDKLS